VTERLPSIVIVHGHDLGRHVGPYGRGAPTPAVDRFASSAVTFERAFAPAPQCSPSRASLITGKYPTKSGMMGLAHLDWHLNDHREALPHRLRELGYATLLVGEQHEATEGELLGYERCIGTRWPQLAREVAPAFVAALDGLDPNRPFFASVGFFEAHRPFDHPGYVDDDPATVPLPPYLPDTPAVRRDVAAFQGRVRGFDEGVGQVLAALEARGRDADTIVVVTTDHGIAFPRAKGTLFDAGLETGLLIRWPGITRPGARSDALLLNLDLYPTLLRAAGGEPDPSVDGVDFRPLLGGEATSVRDHIYAQLHWHDAYVPMRALRTERHKLIVDFSGRDTPYYPADVEDSPSGRALRAADATAAGAAAAGRDDRAASGAGGRAAASGGAQPGGEAAGRVALFELAEDPLERRNVRLAASHREIGDALQERLLGWMRETRDPLLADEVGS
jgi:N-sulfoglucosamine sulfohydrolase